MNEQELLAALGERYDSVIQEVVRGGWVGLGVGIALLLVLIFGLRWAWRLFKVTSEPEMFGFWALIGALTVGIPAVVCISSGLYAIVAPQAHFLSNLK